MGSECLITKLVESYIKTIGYEYDSTKFYITTDFNLTNYFIFSEAELSKLVKTMNEYMGETL